MFATPLLFNLSFGGGQWIRIKAGRNKPSVERISVLGPTMVDAFRFVEECMRSRYI
jgi:hypothetical protein